METKICFKCPEKGHQPLANFYKHSQMADGHLNKCKGCTKKDTSKNYENNLSIEGFIEKERKRGRVKYHRLYEGTGKSKPGVNKKYLDKFPEKKSATSRSQSLKRPFEGAEAHHWSYNEPHYKDVVFLSKKDHMKSHRFIIYDQERMMYRRFDNNELLDTKEKHIEFVEYAINNFED